MSDLELVGKGVSGGDWALSYSWHSIILNRVELTNSMPMDSCSIMLKVVGDMDDEVISPVCDDSRARNCSIKGKNLACVTISSKSGVFNRQPVLGKLVLAT